MKQKQWVLSSEYVAKVRLKWRHGILRMNAGGGAEEAEWSSSASDGVCYANEAHNCKMNFISFKFLANNKHIEILKIHIPILSVPV